MPNTLSIAFLRKGGGNKRRENKWLFKNSNGHIANPIQSLGVFSHQRISQRVVWTPSKIISMGCPITSRGGSVPDPLGKIVTCVTCDFPGERGLDPSSSSSGSSYAFIQLVFVQVLTIAR